MELCFDRACNGNHPRASSVPSRSFTLPLPTHVCRKLQFDFSAHGNNAFTRGPNVFPDIRTQGWLACLTPHSLGKGSEPATNHPTGEAASFSSFPDRLSISSQVHSGLMEPTLRLE